MQRNRLRLAVAVSIACTVLLSGCAQPGSTSSAPTTSAITSQALQRPVRSCETPLGCSEFASVRGRDATGEVSWLGTHPLRVTSARFDGVWTLHVATPCNHLQVQVSVQDDVLTPGLVSVTDRGCEDPTGSYQAWTEKLFEQPVQWKLDGDTLTLRNAHATIDLKES